MGDRPVSGEILSPARPALLLDLDGTIYTDAGAIPGAVEAIAALRRAGIPFRFVTNTTRRSRRGLVERLRGYGVRVEPEELFTSVLAGARLLRAREVVRVAPFVAASALEDLDEFDLSGGTSVKPFRSRPEAVVIGDLGERWTPSLLNEAFRYVLDGSLLVALQKDRYWLGTTGLELDAGPYVAAIEFATGRQAVVCGKPAPDFYRGALRDLALPVAADGRETPGGAAAVWHTSAMVGDDLWADVAGAQSAGLQGWLVRTGKFRPDVLEQSGITPDRVLGSVAELPGALCE